MTDIHKEIIGVWKLIYSKTVFPDGKENFPLGPDAFGYLYYSDKGLMAVQISRKPHDSETNNNNYIAYFGRYKIDEERSVIMHFLEGQSFPRKFGPVEERLYKLIDGRLSLRPASYPNHELLWEKA